MIFETLITSAQRGIRPGRTGFQPVMQTSALREDILRQLEPFAAYRHVHQQGSGKNPECCSFRRLRTNIGELFVLVRTVDAGNDYSNRSNKCSHILAITADEIGRFFNSTPANIFLDNPSLFLSNWMGGPESRAVPPQLMSLPHRPALCSQWQSCFGDAALAGVVAQRIRERKQTLFVAQDSTPQSSQMLLKLFAEAISLLNQAERWDATFETTILGNSQALLQGTYKESAESEIQQTGLLRLEVGHQQQVPAELVNSALCVLAREGEKQQSTSSQASAAGVQQAVRQSLQGNSQPTAPPKLPPGRGTTASPPASPSQVLPNTRDARSARSQAPGSTQPPVPLQKEERSWVTWAALVFAFPVAVIFFIVLVVFVREPFVAFINAQKDKLGEKEAVVAEQRDSESEGDVPQVEGDMPQAGGDMSQVAETTKADPVEMVDKQGGGANNGTDSEKKKKPDPKAGPSKREIWDTVRNQVGKFDGTDPQTTKNTNLIKITNKIKHLEDIQRDLAFNFATIRVGAGTFDPVITSQKFETGETIEWLVKQEEEQIGKFVIKDDQIFFEGDGKKGNILHFLIPMRIECTSSKENPTDFFCLKSLLPNALADKLPFTLQLNSDKSTSLTNLFFGGSPLKIPATYLSYIDELSWPQNIKSSVRLEMQTLEKSVFNDSDDPNDPKLGIAIDNNELKISVKSGDQNLVDPIELSLETKLVETGVEVHLKQYSGWLANYCPQNFPKKISMRRKNRTELDWKTCETLADRIVATYANKKNNFEKNYSLSSNFMPEFLWTDLYNAGDIDREFRRKEASFTFLDTYRRYSKSIPLAWRDDTVGGNSQKKFETGFKEVFGEREWDVFSDTTEGGQRSRFSSYAINRPKNIIKEELKNLEKVTRFVSQNPNEDTWRSLLRTKLVKAYLFCKKERDEAMEKIPGPTDKQTSLKDDTKDPGKLHDYWEFCNSNINPLNNELKNLINDTEIGKVQKEKKKIKLSLIQFNNNSGFWAGLLLEELPKAYVCQIAEMLLYQSEGLMSSTDLSKTLTGEIFCTVQMGEKQSEVKIGNIESAGQ